MLSLFSRLILLLYLFSLSPSLSLFLLFYLYKILLNHINLYALYIIVYINSSILKSNSLHVNYILSNKDSWYNYRAYAIFNDINKSTTLVRNIIKNKHEKFQFLQISLINKLINQREREREKERRERERERENRNHYIIFIIIYFHKAILYMQYFFTLIYIDFH
jgi:hypothetical protein